jgi:hypothetical protein
MSALELIKKECKADMDILRESILGGGMEPLDYARACASYAVLDRLSARIDALIIGENS